MTGWVLIRTGSRGISTVLLVPSDLIGIAVNNRRQPKAGERQQEPA
jgi:hypothetical protein